MRHSINSRSLSRGALLGAILAAAASLLPATRIASADAGAAPQARTDEAVSKDLDATMTRLQPLLGGPTTLEDKSRREAIAPEAVPLARKMLQLFDELKLPDVPDAKEQIADMKSRFLVVLYVLGDKETSEKLKASAAGGDAAVSLHARANLLQGDWTLAGKDSAAQAKLADEVEKLAKANPKDDQLTFTAFIMSRTAKTPELRQRLETAASAMTSSLAPELKEMLEQIKKIKTLEAKPVVIAGKDLEGKDFSTEGWKGKVVLVDFWATWCGPCREELPRVKKMYADYHGKGLEVLGISNDFSGEALRKYVKAEEMPWPEIFDEAAAKGGKWHPVTHGFGINSIPIMFLIDKKGVLRTVEARDSMEDLIPKMLAE
jgi:thiol-disulfide isomerase/thioredoxin